MGTRSDIIVQRRDGKFARVYAHWDGYLEGNGKLLNDHYNSQDRAEAVVSFYGRDRGETGAEAKIGKTLSTVWPEQGTWTEYTYVWLIDANGDGAWWVGDPDEGSQTLVLLSLALAGIGVPKPDIKSPFGVLGHRDPTRA